MLRIRWPARTAEGSVDTARASSAELPSVARSTPPGNAFHRLARRPACPIGKAYLTDCRGELGQNVDHPVGDVAVVWIGEVGEQLQHEAHQRRVRQPVT